MKILFQLSNLYFHLCNKFNSNKKLCNGIKVRVYKTYELQYVLTSAN